MAMLWQQQLYQGDWSLLETIMQRNNLLLMMLHTNGMGFKKDWAILCNQYIIIWVHVLDGSTITL